MKRTPLSIGSTIQAKGGSSYTYIIDRVIGDGASSIVYEAHYIDSAYGIHDVRLKECYPYASDIQRIGTELVWTDPETAMDDKAAFTTAYHKLLDFQNTTKLRNSTAHIFDLCEANGTLYSVMDVNEGQTFEQDNSEKLSDILKTTLALARVVEKYHNNGYLHLDIKPSNFLVIPETRELVILFDVDSVASMEDIASGKVKCVSYSKGWAAPEQMQGRIDKLCPATDIYSIGAILFQKVMGRAVENEDIGIFANWNFDGDLFDDVNPTIKRLLREIFKKTLAANIKRRYQNANELISALDEARKVADQDVYLVNEDVFSEITFVGREKNLANMHDSFGNGTKAIFLHGFGGVGKTALARRFAELYATDYDCVQFHRYSNELSTVIDKHMLNVNSDDQNFHRKQLGKICDSTKALIIVDNFDVEDDEDLEYLLSLNVNLIFTTRNDYTQYISSEKIEIVELESLPTEDLIVIFKNEYGKPLSESEEELVKELIEKFGNLTILVPIIAKQIIASKISIEAFANSIENDAFARFDEQSEDIRIRKDGKSQRTNSLDFIRAMFNIAGLSNNHKMALRYLDLLKYHKCLTIKEYRRLTGEKNLNVLNDLQFRNWISYISAENNEETEIKVHQLIYDLVEKDDAPTYENVPGIVSYIENCFSTMKDFIGEDSNEDKTCFDFEKAQCITFALLIYDDVRWSENAESRMHKTALLYSFMRLAFRNNPKKTYELFFNSPTESTYYFNVSGIMGWFDFGDRFIAQAHKWQSMGEQLIEDGLCFEFYDGSKVEFETENEKNEFKKYVAEEEKKSIDALFSNIVIHIPFYVMNYYFDVNDENFEGAQKSIDIVKLIETRLSNSNDISIIVENMSEEELLLFRLNWYLTICQAPKFGVSSERHNPDGVNIETNYEFYYLTFGLLRKVFCNKAHEHGDFLRKAEELIILIEHQNDRFATYGLSENDIINYVPLSMDEHLQIKKTHWSKKAEFWYDSVRNALTTSNNPYDAYKLILTFDYQKEFITNSKINRLVKNGFVDALYEDVRLTPEEKKELLINHIVKEVSIHFKVKGNLKKSSRLLTQLQPKAELYYQALSKMEFINRNWRTQPINSSTICMVDAALVLRRILDKEFFDIYAYIESQISTENIDYIGDLLYLADKLRVVGLIKKSKELKNKILDLCLKTNLTKLSESTIQMILYKIRPLAINYKREDVVSQIDKIPITIARKYSLALLDHQTYALALKYYEPENIATQFMDDYIEMVAIEAYNKIHNHEVMVDIDAMEKNLLKYLDDLFFVTDIPWGHYRNIFDHLEDEDCHRSLHPYWAREFHSSSKLEVNIGLCYLIAQKYDKIPFDDAIQEALNYITEDEDCIISREELDAVVCNIEKMCPKFNAK